MRPSCVVVLISAIGLLSRLQVASAACVVQISDIHLSDFNRSRYAISGDPLGDLVLFSRTVLKSVKPAAVLITGDLADSKSTQRNGRQSVTEWQDYRRAIEAIKLGSGLPESAILDIRGNHDTFDVPHRDAMGDFFPDYSAAGRRNGSARIYVSHVAGGGATKSGCPAATLVGIDASVEPGPARVNFFGRASRELLLDLDQTLTEIRAEHRSKGCRAPIIAYGHFPLETIAHPETQPWWLFATRMPPLPGSAATLKEVLLAHNVSAYLCGHLHDAFGHRLHRLHPRKASGKFLAELETAAWMNDRRFRILDVGNSLSFTDLYFEGPGARARVAPEPSAGDSYRISAEQPSQKVAGFIVLLTSPPDARYSPLLGSHDAPQSGYDSAAATLLAAFPGTSSSPPKVSLRWRCDNSKHSGEAPMSQTEASSSEWTAALPPLPCSSSSVYIQAVASDGSSSEWRPVALRDWQGTRVASAPDAPWPISAELSYVEWAGTIALTVNWLTFGYWSMYAAWAAHFLGLLLLPRLAVAQAPSLATQPPEQLQQLVFPRILALPFTPLFDMASIPSVWWPQVAYSAYLLLGPWFTVSFVRGQGPALCFMGAVLYRQDGSIRWAHMVDSAIPIVIQFCTCLLPLTLLVATACTRMKRRAAGRSLSWGITALQLAILAALLWFHVQTVLRAFGSDGWARSASSPGIAWTVPYFAFLSWRLYSAAASEAFKYRKPLSSSGSDKSSKSE